MPTDPIETDYLVVGAGATAMAFVDTLLTESDADVVIVDRHHRPGGHWNDAYPFVRLHQPSAYYGVASRELSNWTKDEAGLNQGLYGLASGAEVLAHFDQVMQQRFLPSSRVRWHPMSEVSVGTGTAHTISSLTSGETREVQVRRKLVDATHARTEVPATCKPKYAIAPGMHCVPLNDLPRIDRPHATYTVVGAGKTGMDACLWLLQNGVPPARIRWIMPRDAWLMDRANHQPGADDFDKSIASVIAQFESVVEATSVADLFARLEKSGQLQRIDPNVEPTTYRCAVVSQGELAQLRRIHDIVRLGHLQAIEPSRIVLERGALTADPDTLYIDCSAGAIQMPPPVPVFDGDRINLLMVRTCQPLFSSALIAFVESHYDEPALMNALCTPVPSPSLPIDWLRMLAASIANGGRWGKEPKLGAWLAACRLNFFTAMLRGVDMSDTTKTDRLKESGAKAGAAARRAAELLAAQA